MDSPPHPIFHFGMTGSFHMRGKEQMVYRRDRDSDKAEVSGVADSPFFGVVCSDDSQIGDVAKAHGLEIGISKSGQIVYPR
jgi:hypothetical protein